MRRSALALHVLLAGCALLLTRCEMRGADRPALETRADSVAMRAYEAMGGPEAWAAMPYLRFDFGFENDGVATTRNKHLWNRRTGDYRLEWSGGADSTYVALFNVQTQAGEVYLNGQPVAEEERDELLQRAYRSHINDAYWLMAPVKMFDEGVTRTYVADSSDAEHEVVHLAFEGVGLTPGDQYWMYVNTETGLVDAWRFRLQGGNEGHNRWEAYGEHQTPAGPVRIASRKPPAGGGRGALLTNNVDTPATVDAELFTSPQPRL